MLVAVALLAMVTWGSRAGGPFTIALRGSGASVRPIEGDAPRHKRWLVFTRERSGTRWLMNTMVDRGAGRVAPSRELMCGRCRCGIPLASFNATGRDATLGTCATFIEGSFSKREELVASTMPGIASAEGGASNGTASVETPHVGYKFMTPGTMHEYCNKAHNMRYSLDAPRKGPAPHSFVDELDPEAFEILARTVCSLEIPFVFMWRRNVLRRIVSFLANEHDKKKPSTSKHDAHPKSEDAVKALQKFKPTLRIASLVSSIDHELRTQRALEEAFARLQGSCIAARNARVLYYEDLVDGAPRAREEWEDMFARLRIPYDFDDKLWHADADLKVIHGSKPVLDTIANAQEVHDALASTPHAWMLQAR